MKKYDRMKDSGYPWMGEIPSHWRDINPKALFTQRKERAKEGERQLTASQQYGVLYQDEYMSLTGSRVVVVQKDFDILKHVEAGDFVISMRSFQGGIEYSPVSGSISSAYVMLIPNKELVYPPFYRWLLKSSAYIRALQSTTDLVRDGQAMRYSNFAKVRLLVAPLEDQRAIAAYLDDKVGQIDSIIEEEKASIEEYKRWKTSAIFEAVTKGLNPKAEMKNSGVQWIGKIPKGWTCCQMKRVIKLINGRAYKDTEFEEDGKYKVLRVGNLFTNSKWYTSSLELEEDKYCENGDLIYAWSASYGPYIWNGEKVIYHYHIWKTKLDSSINKMFAYYYLLALSRNIASESHGSAMAHVTMEKMNNSFIVFPSYKEQEAIAKTLTSEVEMIDSLITEKEKLLVNLESYKRSLIYETVTGKRKVV